MTQLIGLIGKAGVGKDTVALHLWNEHNLRRYSFAAPLRDMLGELLGDVDWDDREWKERKIDWIGKSPRELLQTLGTEWGRNLVHPHLWVLRAEQEWQCITQRLHGLADGMVVSDVRFTNEADWIISRGGTLIEILRPDAAPVASHASEQQDLAAFPRYVVRNTGTFNDLRLAIDDVLGKIRQQ